MKLKNAMILLTCIFLLSACNQEKPTMKVFETSREGNLLTEVSDFETSEPTTIISIDRNTSKQTLVGFGAAFTEASAYLMNELGPENRREIIEAYFSEQGSNYSLMRTHMNSCDFSLTNYSYSPVEGDTELQHFSIEEDRDDLIPFIKEAQETSSGGFKLFASPWTAAPWMKDNNSWVGGKLLPKYYPTWAKFFSKYVDAYESEGIPIWGFTVENEPHGNGNSWESMLYSPDEMVDFVKNHLGPTLEKDGKGDKIIMGYDQNREGIKEWADVMYANEENSKYFDGMAIHWYESTVSYFPEMLEYAHEKAPGKLLIETEGCIDNQVPVWRDDEWYWKKEATDWGYYWRQDDQKYLHPKYAPAHRYARDIIGCLNHWVEGWVDWNMVLDRQGGPNWFKNWCIAPVIADTENDEIYFTPLYYIMSHFSKFMRPGAEVLTSTISNDDLMSAAVLNEDGSLIIAVFNEGEQPITYSVEMEDQNLSLSIPAQALQTIVLAPNE